MNERKMNDYLNEYFNLSEEEKIEIESICCDLIILNQRFKTSDNKNDETYYLEKCKDIIKRLSVDKRIHVFNFIAHNMFEEESIANKIIERNNMRDDGTDGYKVTILDEIVRIMITIDFE